jgi:hypothetical protein
MRRALLSLVFQALLVASACAPEETSWSLENEKLQVTILDSASVHVLDKTTNTSWSLGSPRLIMKDERSIKIDGPPLVSTTRVGMDFTTADGSVFHIDLDKGTNTVEYRVDPSQDVEEVLLLDRGLQLESGEKNYFTIPHRLGIMIPVKGEKSYTRRFPAYTTGSGYSMAMAGAVKDGSGILLHWEDPYTEIIVDYTAGESEENRSGSRLTMGLAVRNSANLVRVQPIGEASYGDIAKAYRTVARRRGFLKTLKEKVSENPDVEKFFGSADFKPFAYMPTAPNTRWNETDETVVLFRFSFDECARLAQHFKEDLGIERSLLVLNGWINGGYDNLHPDILPAAEIMGGNKGLADCSRRVKELGWVFGLHDNYQDMYKEAKSWDESYLIKNPDGTSRQGGVWAGGQCWLICSRAAVDLASRPQNVPGVVKLCDPDLYFSDTIFAAGLYECSDPNHPATKVDDILYKQKLCDYLRKEVGLFGSEEGREWGVPHADYFEGLLSHKTGFHVRRDPPDIIIPMFHIVFGDCIPIYTHQSDRPRPDEPDKILHHVLYAEMPVYYFGEHLYWQDPKQDYKIEDEGKALYSQGGRFNRIDQFIKNTYEFLSPLHRLTATKAMNHHEFLTDDRTVEKTVFDTDVEVIVNYGERDFSSGDVVLPQWGFLIRSPKLVAFCARSYDGLDYEEPTLFVIESRENLALSDSGKIRIYRGFGGDSVMLNGKTVTVDVERIIEKN